MTPPEQSPPKQSPLERSLRARIQAVGPLPVEAVMAEALAAYYHSRDPLGALGDFTTAPEISQMFGEMLGLWAVVGWQQMGAPLPLKLVEIGPGRGTLMADALRAIAMAPPLAQGIEVHLVETSPALRARQRQSLANLDVVWHDRVEDVPPGPAIILANEFLDALPVRQAVKTADGWRERMVGLADGRLAFLPGAPVAPDHPLATADAPEGAIVEWAPAAVAVVQSIGRRLAEQGGLALFLDYGPAESGLGESLQAVKAHDYHPVLEDLGEADLTAHVDFAAAARAARQVPGLKAYGPLPQGEFLQRLGINQRAETLARAQPDKKVEIGLALRRLIHIKEMGTLFKALVLCPGRQPVPAGFES